MRPTSYASYLRLPNLLAAQDPTTPRDDAGTWVAERFFIVCHQTTELWLSQVLLELDHAARCAEESSDWPGTRTSLMRAASIVLLLTHHLEQLIYLPRDRFLRFRPALEGISGAESEQMRELFVVGLGRHAHVRTIEVSLDQALARAGMRTPHALGACGHDECATAGALGALMEGVTNWRRLHARITRYFIGGRRGTGGTAGADYLDERLGGLPDTAAPEARRRAAQ